MPTVHGWQTLRPACAASNNGHHGARTAVDFCPVLCSVVTPTAPNPTQPKRSKSANEILALLVGRVALLAAGVDAFYLLFFLLIGSPWLAWMNLVSVSMYAVAYALVQRRRLKIAVILIWLEAFPHALIGTLMLGWESGFHYLLLMFIPAVTLSVSTRRSTQFVVFMLLYLGLLDALAHYFGPLAPISAANLIAIKWINISIFVAMFSALAIYYRGNIATVERRLQKLVSDDVLTGLANRRRFDEALASEWSRASRTRKPIGLILLDVDNFKRYNDSYGHQAGDECLRNVAAVLQQNTRRPSDLAARYGGEEFAVIVADMNAEGVLQLAETMRRALEALALPHALSPLNVVTISAGVAVLIPNSGWSARDLVRMADQALYRAKDGGRNRVESSIE